VATKAFKEMVNPYIGAGVRVFLWENLINGDDGEPLYLPQHSDKTVQVIGTFGVGGTCLIEGSCMTVTPTYGTLNDSQGNALSFTAAKLETVLEDPYIIRPRVSAGDVTTDLDVYILVKI